MGGQLELEAQAEPDAPPGAAAAIAPEALQVAQIAPGELVAAGRCMLAGKLAAVVGLLASGLAVLGWHTVAGQDARVGPLVLVAAQAMEWPAASLCKASRAPWGLVQLQVEGGAGPAGKAAQPTVAS